METNDGQVTKKQAQAELEALKATKRMAITSARPPRWLICCAAVLIGAATGLSVVRDQSPTLFALQMAAVALFLTTFVYWLVYLRRLGLIMPMLPRNLATTAFWLLQGVLFIGVVVGASVLYDNYGFMFSPYLAALINGYAFAWLVHRFPTGEWISGGCAR